MTNQLIIIILYVIIICIYTIIIKHCLVSCDNMLTASKKRKENKNNNLSRDSVCQKTMQLLLIY